MAVQDPFNPNSHLMQIKNKGGSTDYLPVQWRLVWFREAYPQGMIETELVTLDLDRETEEEGYQWNQEARRSEKVVKRANGYALFKATVKDGKGGVATGYKSEKAASFGEYLEKAETGARGRALAALGFGTQFAPDLDIEDHIVDAPVDRSIPTQVKKSVHTAASPPVTTTVQEGLNEATASDQQLTSIRKLCTLMSRPEPENMDAMTYQDAKALIIRMSHEYNEGKQARKYEAANTVKREVANLKMTEKQLTELKVAFAVAFLVDAPEVNDRFARWVGLKFQGAVTVETLTTSHYKPLLDLIDQEAQEGAVS